MSPIRDIASELETRRKRMRLSCHLLAKQCKISPRTVQRVLRGEVDPSISTLSAIAEILGAGIGIKHRTSPRIMVRKHAMKKAREIVRMAQANAAIEGLTVSDKTTKTAVRQIASELVAGSAIRLWG